MLVRGVWGDLCGRTLPLLGDLCALESANEADRQPRASWSALSLWLFFRALPCPMFSSQPSGA